MKPRTTPTTDTAPHGLESINVDVLQSLFDLTPDVAFFVKDAQGCYVAVNDSLIKRHGLSRREDAIGKRPIDISTGDFGRIPTEQDAYVLRTGKPLIDRLELQWHLPQEPVWCLTSKIPLRDKQDGIIGLIGFSRDVRAEVNKDEIPRELAEAMAEFEQDLSGEMSPSRLAERSGLTASRLARLTKKLFGFTPSQFIVKTRMTEASRLLRDSELAVSEIAVRCGYSDQSAFTRAFRTLTGITPKDFRKRYQSLS